MDLFKFDSPVMRFLSAITDLFLLNVLCLICCIPIVTIDHVFDNRMVVLSDNVRGMKDLLTYVYQMGHRRIAYIHGADSAVTQSRLSSFYRTAYDLGLEVPDEYVLEAPYRNTDETYAKTLQLLDLPNPPTCILYPDDFASFGGVNAIRSRRLSIPEDVSVAGYDGIRIGRHLEPKLTTLRQDTDRIGRLAAGKLVDMIEHPKTTVIERVIVEGTLYEGASVADLRQKLPLEKT